MEDNGKEKEKVKGGYVHWFLLRAAGAVCVPSVPVHHTLICSMCMFEWDVLYLTLFHLSICVCLSRYLYIYRYIYTCIDILSPYCSQHFSHFLGSLSTVSPPPASKENNISFVYFLSDSIQHHKMAAKAFLQRE